MIFILLSIYGFNLNCVVSFFDTILHESNLEFFWSKQQLDLRISDHYHPGLKQKQIEI